MLCLAVVELLRAHPAAVPYQPGSGTVRRRRTLQRTPGTHVGMVQLLLNHGADVPARNRIHPTPLFAGCHAYAWDWDIRNVFEETEEAIGVHVSAGSELSQCDDDGQGILHTLAVDQHSYGPRFMIDPRLKIKHLLQLLHRILRPINRVPDRALIHVDLIVIAALKRLVTKEVDGRIFDAGDVLLRLDVLQAERLVPARGEHVEGDLAADGEAKYSDDYQCWG